MTGNPARRQRGRVVRAPYLKSGGRGLNYAVFLPSFELGGITKHLMTCPVGNSEVCFPSTSMFPSGNIECRGEQNSLFSLGPVIFVSPRWRRDTGTKLNCNTIPVPEHSYYLTALLTFDKLLF